MRAEMAIGVFGLAARFIVRALFALTCSGAAAALAQDFGDTPYVQTPQNVVDRMLELAKVSPADYVIDLGSGDGRMIITAAKKFGARGFGVDLDRRLVELSNRLAAREGLADRAVFYVRDLYETDLTAASVVTIYLLPEVNLMVRPKLLSTLKPGTRIVSHDYDMGEWPPDVAFDMEAPGKTVGRDMRSKVFYWVVPANAAGRWSWRMQQAGKPVDFELSLTQNFQKISGTLTAAGRPLTLANARLQGEEIAFTASDKGLGMRYEFAGRINGNSVNGTILASGPTAQRQAEWEATRVQVGTPAHALLKKPDLREFSFPDAAPVR